MWSLDIKQSCWNLTHPNKHLEVSFLHIGTSTNTRVLCATKTVPSDHKHPILGRLSLRERERERDKY